MRTQNRPPRRGIFMVDAMLGLFLIVAITAGLGAVVANQRRAAIREAEDRAAVRAAETTLTELQSRQLIPPVVQIERLDAPAPTGWMWIEAVGHSGDRRVVVAGLVPVAGGH